MAPPAVSQLIGTAFIGILLAIGPAHAGPWDRHTIDSSSQGADGVRLADANGDGRLDIATGWEEGGVVRIYLQPPPNEVQQPWPMVEVGHVASPEDAVLVDVDGDGHADVVSCCEGKTKSVFVHWNPGLDVTGQSDSDKPTAWNTEAIPQLQSRLPWMFCLPVFDQHQQLTELVIGSKGGTGEIGRLIPPKDNRRNLQAWNWQPLSQAGWIMSIQSGDPNGDGRPDILYSDRRNDRRGIHWLIRPDDPRETWQKLTVGGQNREVMFIDIGDLNNDGHQDIVSAVRGPHLLVLTGNASRDGWSPVEIPYPPHTGTGKGVAIGDIDGNQVPDLVCSCENAKGKTGVYWLSASADISGPWTFHDVSGHKQGIKFDRIELLDLDSDGDLDILTCEERDQLGVIWYENPYVSAGR